MKICGITSLSDALAAATAGADAVGLNFVGGPRRIDPVTAGRILDGLPPLVTPVALVRIEAGGIPDEVRSVLKEHSVRHLQVYGLGHAGELAALNRQGFLTIPVLPVRGERLDTDAEQWLATDDSRPGAIVLDAFDPAREGGTGSTFPWAWLAAAREAGRLAGWPPIILAGGLRPDNVADAVRTVVPYAVDVSSGVELKGSPGRKDPELMRAFVIAAKSALGG